MSFVRNDDLQRKALMYAPIRAHLILLSRRLIDAGAQVNLIPG